MFLGHIYEHVRFLCPIKEEKLAVTVINSLWKTYARYYGQILFAQVQ